ncbi:hypothetical protein BKA57DRAFT_436848 [Linnemannia elongata]|nr:hypothetical protein BKA57DRAFT_436848 [Linnemannia elongata]
MTGRHQHPQHHRANKPSTNGLQLLPLNDGDVDMLHGDGGDNGTQAIETPTNLVEPAKELTNPISTPASKSLLSRSPSTMLLLRGRQFEINSLQSGTTKDRIKGAFTPLGEVEFVNIARKRNGAMVTATVTFVTDRPVKELQEQGTRVMFVGNHSGRITSLGNEEIVFHKDLDRRKRESFFSFTS